MIKILICHFCQESFDDNKKIPRELTECDHKICEECLVNKLQKELNFLCVIDLTQINISNKTINDFPKCQKLIYQKSSMESMQRFKQRKSSTSFDQDFEFSSETDEDDDDEEIIFRQSLLTTNENIQTQDLFKRQSVTKGQIREQKLENDQTYIQIQKNIQQKYITLVNQLNLCEEKFIKQIRSQFKENYEKIENWQNNQIDQMKKILESKVGIYLDLQNQYIKKFTGQSMSKNVIQKWFELKDKFNKKILKIKNLFKNSLKRTQIQVSQFQLDIKLIEVQPIQNTVYSSKKPTNFLKQVNDIREFTVDDQLCNVYKQSNINTSRNLNLNMTQNKKTFLSNSSNEKLFQKRTNSFHKISLQEKTININTIEEFINLKKLNLNKLDLSKMIVIDNSFNHFFKKFKEINQIEKLILPKIKTNEKYQKMIFLNLCNKQISLINFSYFNFQPDLFWNFIQGNQSMKKIVLNDKQKDILKIHKYEKKLKKYLIILKNNQFIQFNFYHQIIY